MVHPDEYWQSTQPAYKHVYGEDGDVWLPWEWTDDFRLRNFIYPMYLAMPMQLCKTLGVDTNLVIRYLPYIAHMPVVLLNDLFMWKVGKRVVGRDASRLGFLIYFFNRFETMHLIRTLTNSIEQMFTLVAFYYYLDQKNKFTMNTVILTTLISIAFMMRNTSPVGWIPLLAIKVLREGSLVPFLISGLFVALPILFFCVWVDTTMYKADTWVLTGYNFLEMNILHGLSKTFGEDNFWWYITHQIPFNCSILLPFVFASTLWYHPKICIKQNNTAYLTFYTIFYLCFFGFISHKEARFMLPIWPFLMLTTAELLSNILKSKRLSSLFAWVIKIYIIVEILTLYVMETKFRGLYKVRAELAAMEPPIHSAYLSEPLWSPHYTIMHRQDSPIKIYTANQNPMFYR